MKFIQGGVCRHFGVLLVYTYATSLLLFSMPLRTEAMPTFLVETGKTKCYMVEAPVDTILRVDYEARDIDFSTDSASSNPTYIDISVQPSNRIIRGDLHEAPVRDHLRPTKEVITAATGTVYHKMEVDGTASVCIRAPRRDLRKTAKNKVADRQVLKYSVRIQATDEVPEKYKTKPADVNDHLSYMELEMGRIKVSMEGILRQADYAKDQDAAMHRQFEAFNATTFYWPMMQIFLLIVTGFAQVHNIVHFFKTRRII